MNDRMQLDPMTEVGGDQPSEPSTLEVSPGLSQAPSTEPLDTTHASEPVASGDRLEALLQESEAAHARQLAEYKEKAARWEAAFRQTLKERELAALLSGRPLLAGAAAQLIKLWRDELEVVDEGGSHKVRARDGRSLEQAVTDWLAAPEYGHFVQPSTRGGTSGRGPNPARLPGTAPPAPPRTLGEAVLQRWREATERSQAGGLNVPGLSPRRSR